VAADVSNVGRPVYLFDELESTNAVAATLPPESVVIADHQTAGRGQYGRSWTARPGSSLLMSIVLDPPAGLRRAVVLTAWAAVGVAESIRRLAGLPTRIKWPNDLLLREKKVCGILTEQGRSVVCGVGLNVNQSADDFAVVGLTGATSLSIETGEPFDLRSVAEVVIRSLDEAYDRLLLGELTDLETEWVVRTGLLGREVKAESADGSSVAGRVRAMGFDGIELDGADGTIRVLVPEHVRQLRPV
jgi:BirA family biotin operon repressor/biotin-[acetyl-CoA-carboxylase] ligase